ncbi:MAG TPA: hypothetical protein DCP92_23595 [Nitrospiraceae bacterium]|nr:hypothetical protein [Nitrospiraceae bacterium]
MGCLIARVVRLRPSSEFYCEVLIIQGFFNFFKEFYTFVHGDTNSPAEVPRALNRMPFVLQRKAREFM